MIYCNLISPQFVGDSTVDFMRTFTTASIRHHEYRNVHYVPGGAAAISGHKERVPTLEGLHVPLEDSETLTKVVLHFPKHYQW